MFLVLLIYYYYYLILLYSVVRLSVPILLTHLNSQFQFSNLHS
jgi:hypothetical protein